MTRHPDLISKVRQTTAAVARQASLVRIQEDRLSRYPSVARERYLQSSVDATQMDVGPSEARLGFVLMRDATNFGSGYHPFVKKLSGLSGARTLGSHLAAHVRAHGVPDAEWLLSATDKDCAAIFHQEPTGPVGELMVLFASAWNELGRYLRSRFRGSSLALVEEAGHSAVALVELLAEMSFFQDRALYDQLEVYFFKRAQLTALDLSLALGGANLGRFDDLHELTVFVDNLIPHVLRVDDLLVYDEGLLDDITKGALIASGSAAEVEIRACALQAVSELSRLCAEAGDPATELELGDWLWNRGQGAKYKALPRHRTRCVFY